MSAPAFRHDAPGVDPDRWRSHPRRAQVEALRIDAAELDRVVVVAAHPDDESLGAAGLAATLHDAGVPVHVVVATAGEGSHPHSATHSPEQLAEVRRRELAAATDVLIPRGTHEVWDLPDGSVAAHEDSLVARLVGVLGDGRRTLVLATWRQDGHPDHEAVGRAAAAACVRTGARLLEYPVWYWHWASPGSAPWDDLRVVALDAQARSRKESALRCHVSQVEGLSDRRGDEPVVTQWLRRHHAGDHELFVVQRALDPALDLLHQDSDDPWGTDTSWYEQRKRDLTLAMLPRRRYARALDIGCSAGALTERLLEPCDELIATDRSPRAVELAQHRLGGRLRGRPGDQRSGAALPTASVRIEVLDIPRQWPTGRFDLIVLSEVGYFMAPADLEETLRRVDASLAPGGTVLLAHWRHPIEAWPLDGADVHAHAARVLSAPSAVYRDEDVEIVVHERPS